MQTIHDFLSAATPGSRWMCIDRLYPEASGLRTVAGASPTAITFTGHRHGDLTTFTDGRLDLHSGTEIRIDGDTAHIQSHQGSEPVVWTWTLLAVGTDREALKPPLIFVASPVSGELRGPESTPWCVYDPDLGMALATDGRPATAGYGAAYFATQPEAEELAELLWPPGARWDTWGVATPSGEWAYAVDDNGIMYGDGPWPFHGYPDHEPRSIRLAPDTAYYAWRNEYVGIRPQRFGLAETTLNLFVRMRGGGAVTVPCPITFDLLTGTFTIAASCPPTLLQQATSKARKILDLIALAYRERDTYLRPWTAADQYVTDRATGTAVRSAPERERRTEPLAESVDVSADVDAVRQAHGVWQRAGTDSWVTVDGASRTPRIHRLDTAAMLRFGSVRPLASPPLPQLERLGKALLGRTISIPPGLSGYRRWELTVEHAEYGFVYGPTTRGYRMAVHLAATDLYGADPTPIPKDRSGQPIRVGDAVREFSRERHGSMAPGESLGTCRIVGIDEDAGVLFTDRNADHGQPETAAFPQDVELAEETTTWGPVLERIGLLPGTATADWPAGSAVPPAT